MTADSDSRRRWLALMVLCLGVLMIVLDTTIVNVALPSIRADLGFTETSLVWVVNAYMLTFGGFLLLGGRLGDLYGHRRLFLAGLVLFTLASLACGLSRSQWLLIAARAIQGLGGAVVSAVSLSLIMNLFREPAERAKAMGVYGFVCAGGGSIGVLLGGLLTSTLSWHWIFLVNVPVGLIGLAATLRFMPVGDRFAVKRFDGVGYALLAFGMVAVSLALDSMSGKGIHGAMVFVLLIFGLASLAAYWLHALRRPDPLFAPELFAVRSLRVGLLGNLFSRLGSSCMPFLIPLVLQVCLGFSPLQAGMMMLPTVLASMAMKRQTTTLIQRIGYRRVLMGNTLVLSLMIASFGTVSTALPLWVVIVQLLIFGATNSMQFTAMNTVTLKDLDAGNASSGNSLLSMVQMLAMGMGVAAAGAVLAGFSEWFGGDTPQHTLNAFRATFVCMGAVTLASTMIFSQLGDDEDVRPKPLEPAEHE